MQDIYMRAKKCIALESKWLKGKTWSGIAFHKNRNLQVDKNLHCIAQIRNPQKRGVSNCHTHKSSLLEKNLKK